MGVRDRHLENPLRHFMRFGVQHNFVTRLGLVCVTSTGVAVPRCMRMGRPLGGAVTSMGGSPAAPVIAS